MTDGRLLPWPGPDGSPCRLIGKGWLHNLADEMEETQLVMGESVLRIAERILGDEAVPVQEMRYLARQLSMVLTDVLRVAQSRGERLAAVEQSAEDDDPT